jgi:phosphoribosylanthranilate isomerase
MMIKICGITRATDAEAVAHAGADAIGFVFTTSARRIDLATAAAIGRSVTGDCRRVGVFVDTPLEDVRRAIDVADLDVAQFHGDEPAADCARMTALGVTVWKRVAVRADDTAATLADRSRGFDVAALLIDPGKGDGQAFCWSLAKELPGPVIIAGGLNPANIAAAIDASAPYGVDVSSGVETAPGIKDAKQIAAFVGRARVARQTPRTEGQDGHDAT